MYQVRTVGFLFYYSVHICLNGEKVTGFTVPDAIKKAPEALVLTCQVTEETCAPLVLLHFLYLLGDLVPKELIFSSTPSVSSCLYFFSFRIQELTPG